MIYYEIKTHQNPKKRKLKNINLKFSKIMKKLYANSSLVENYKKKSTQ